MRGSRSSRRRGRKLLQGCERIDGRVCSASRPKSERATAQENSGYDEETGSWPSLKGRKEKEPSQKGRRVKRQGLGGRGQRRVDGRECSRGKKEKRSDGDCDSGRGDCGELPRPTVSRPRRDAKTWRVPRMAPVCDIFWSAPTFINEMNAYTNKLVIL